MFRAGHAGSAGVRVDIRREAHGRFEQLAAALGAGEDAGSEPGQEGRADCGGLDLGGAQNLIASVVGDHLEKQRALRQAAVDAQGDVAEPERLAEVDAAMRDAIEHRASELRASRASGQAEEGW